jgi:steroid delta-isomerase-like uncharacterized protein
MIIKKNAGGTMTMSIEEENKAIHRRVYEEIWNKGNLSIVDEVFVDNYIFHPLPQHKGPKGYKEMYHNFAGAFSDFHCEIEDMIAEGDKVMVRTTITGMHKREYMGIAPTGKQISVSEIAVVRIKDDKIVEEWGLIDFLGMIQQLGAIPSQ